MSTLSNPTISPPSDPAAVRRPSGWRGLVLRLHFYAGLLIGPFILVATVTGVLYVLTPQLENWLYADQLRVPPTAQPLPLADQVRAAAASHPGGDLVAVRPAPEPGATTRVLFDDGLGESERRTVFVDPGTGAVKGSLVTYGTSGVLPLRMTIDQLHRTLLLGEPGRLYSELAASWLWVVALGGLALWVARWRVRRAASRVSARELLRAEPGATGRRRMLSRHGSLGVWLLLGALFLSATGLTWSTYAGENVSSLRAAIGWSTPSLQTELAGGHAGHGGGAAPAGARPVDPAQFDGVLAAARAAGIDSGQVEIARPAEPGAAWTVTEIKRSWPTEVDGVAVDGDTGAVVDQVRFADYPLMAKLARWGIDAHMGVLFGVANQLVLVAFGLGMITLIIFGYRMWWRRRPTRGRVGWRGGRPVPRGQLRRTSRPTVFVAVVLAVAIGWFAPLFGLSLLAFLVIDGVLGWRARRRATEPQPDAEPDELLVR